jgi:hypothetical protein
MTKRETQFFMVDFALCRDGGFRFRCFGALPSDV